MKPVGKPDAGNPHVRFDERGGETGRPPWSAPAPFLDSTKAEQYVAEAEKRNPGVALNIVNRSQILRSRADVYMGQKRWSDAIENIRATISTYADQARRDPGNQLFVNEQPALYAMLADCLVASGQRDAAVSNMQNAIARFQDIEARRPLVPEEEEVRRGQLAKLAALQSAP